MHRFLSKGIVGRWLALSGAFTLLHANDDPYPRASFEHLELRVMHRAERSRMRHRGISEALGSSTACLRRRTRPYKTETFKKKKRENGRVIEDLIVELGLRRTLSDECAEQDDRNVEATDLDR